MSTSYGDRLPQKAIDFLHFNNRSRKNSAIFLVTADPDGFPHVALLSPYQVVDGSDNELYLAVHKGTRSQQFLHTHMKGTLILQLQPAVEYLKISVHEASGWDSRNDEVLYRAVPTEVLEDYSDKAPFVSELLFGQKNIYEHYKAGFEKTAEYITSHQSS